MLKIEKYAAIDIGSNAIRLLISTVTTPENKPTHFKKTSLIRVPIRLGSDVFVNKRISEANYQRMLKAMESYKLLMELHQISKYRACATSAMRDAENGDELAKEILQNTGINIEIINGDDEAAIIAATDLQDLISSDSTYLYVDVGGGSTELTIYHEGKTVASKSFQIGTVRLLNELVSDEDWRNFETWIKTNTRDFSKVKLIGSGGNINNIFKNSGKKIGKPLSFFYMSSYYQLLNSLTYEERIVQLGLNQDRADVIIPATKIYLTAMKFSKAKNVYVPKIGLVDGIVKSLYQADSN
ncbi:Ppx/GppA phosphatase family protein [Psychroflexus planctonicus]|uniref:Exopolyphosphatase n=1 Tax=Psychroflexus planctonicus TaxID=1526575 RepID=A0ABQ1SF59_9FLAO|nr:exopolyphosphatase [Psychroflexus planctonicus]GGE29267.1 exopolyphosphatase [Psychroflexus planctonicus]